MRLGCSTMSHSSQSTRPRGRQVKPSARCQSTSSEARSRASSRPLSIALTTDAVYDAFYDDATARGFLHSHSYTGNALACRAALATLDIFAEDDVLAQNRIRAQQLGNALAPLGDLAHVKHLRQKGMIAAFDVTTDDPAFSRKFYRAALAREALVRPIGNTVYVMPPYIVSDEEIAHLGQAIEGALQESMHP